MTTIEIDLSPITKQPFFPSDFGSLERDMKVIGTLAQHILSPVGNKLKSKLESGTLGSKRAEHIKFTVCSRKLEVRIEVELKDGEVLAYLQKFTNTEVENHEGSDIVDSCTGGFFEAVAIDKLKELGTSQDS